MGRHDAPFHIGYDDDHGPLNGREFVYRRPVTPAQTYDLLSGCVFGHGGFAMDGDDHWTVPAMREWWQEHGRDTPIASRFVPVVTKAAASPPKPWWQRLGW